PDMNLPAALLSIRWLVRDTFRQSLATGVFWAMLAVSALCILVCLTANADDIPNLPTDGTTPERITREEAKKYDPEEVAKSGVVVTDGRVTLLFGAFSYHSNRWREDAVRELQLMLAGFVADGVGLLLALVWTAGFLPAFLDPAAATVLLAKPAPRWSLLAGKYLGVVIFVGLQAAVFVLGTWAALGLRTGVWDMRYLWCLPVLVCHFAIFFSFSTFLAVWTRST